MLHNILRTLLLIICTLSLSNAFGQLNGKLEQKNVGNNNDSSKTKKINWHDESIRIIKQKLNQEVGQSWDTTLHDFHEKLFYKNWQTDIGNQGSPNHSWWYLPLTIKSTGLTSGCNSFNAYRFNSNEVEFYNTNKPYAEFIYQMGSKLEQLAQILHTQNIKPNWNIAASYRKITSTGFFKIQRTNLDNAFFTTNYQSLNHHYELKGIIVYNKEQNDENGGIVADSLLNEAKYNDRKTIPVLFQNDGYSTLRSSITNVQRDYNFNFVQQYNFGKTDTFYNADSTQYYLKLASKFHLIHELEFGSEKLMFKNLQPDSAQYSSFFSKNFSLNDSVFYQQKWKWVDNQLHILGFFGNNKNRLKCLIGAGIRAETFQLKAISNINKLINFGTYIKADIAKLNTNQSPWEWNANGLFYTSGLAAGNLFLNAQIIKKLSNLDGQLKIELTEQISNASYNQTIYANQYFSEKFALLKSNNSKISGEFDQLPLHFSVKLNYNLLSNYTFLADSFFRVSSGHLLVNQYAPTFNVFQITISKNFYFKNWVSDHQINLQKTDNAAPLHLPFLMYKTQLSLEKKLFNNKLKVATGMGLSYYSGFKMDAYSALYNRFYFQDTYKSPNQYNLNVFFNFNVKRFKCYLTIDQLQQLYHKNFILAPNYVAPNLIFRFGFNWAMIN